MSYPKFFIGPMSKKVVDTVISHNQSENNPIGFIPSRRQIECSGGYVNGWTTEEFSNYVDNKALIERDHGGLGQGHTDNDDEYESFKADAENLDIIHVDPWKKLPDYEDGLVKTIEYINFIYDINSSVKFEVGTEEAIRYFSSKELEQLLHDLEKKLNSKVFDNILYAVVQSGVGLDLGSQKNTGTFSSQRLSEMIEVCKKFGVKSKEHNGDYLSNKEIRQRFDCGLDSLNIAPEFGQIETLCYLENIPDIEEWYNICYESKRWEKWVSKDFIPEQNKEELIKICGHYVLSHPDFLEIKQDIDNIIEDRLATRIKELFE